MTVYYLDCQATALAGALDRFSAFFSCPLFLKDTIDREIKAVDSEHTNNIHADHWRLHQLSRTVLGQPSQHKYASFGTGNLASLLAHDTDLLRDAVMNFYNQYYKACNMTLSVMGNQTLEELQLLMTKYFSDIPQGSIAQNKPALVDTLKPGLPIQLNVVPVSDHITLQIQWPMREIISLYKTKPTRHLSHLIGHEGPGSLLMALRAKGWAHELGADDVSKSFREFSIFTVEIELTQDGYEHVQEVVKMVFAYLALLRDLPSWVHEELKATSDIQFRFLSKRSPSDTVSSLASSMQHYPPDLFLSGPFKLFEFDPKLIYECWSEMSPENMLIIVSSKDYEGTTDLTDPWYGTNYQRIEIDKDFLMQLKDPMADKELVKDLRLPELNDMLATEFQLVTRHPAFKDAASLPRCLVDNPTCRLWYKPDTNFEMPKVNIMIALRSATAYASSPLHSVLASLWVEVVREDCNEFSYAASMAGLHSDFANTRSGVEIHVSGYNDKAGILLQRIVNAILMLPEKLSDELFHRIVDVSMAQNVLPHSTLPGG
jgi:insulysin